MTIKSLSNSARGLNLDTVGTDNDEHDILHVCIKVWLHFSSFILSYGLLSVVLAWFVVFRLCFFHDLWSVLPVFSIYVDWSPVVFKLWTANCELWLGTVNCKLQTANCKLWTVNCELQTANCELQTANCELWTVKCKLQPWNWTATWTELQTTNLNCCLHQENVKSLNSA